MNINEEMVFEEHINRIFERAHIPEWANDAKYPIISLHKSMLASQREEFVRMVEDVKGRYEFIPDYKAACDNILMRLARLTEPKVKPTETE